MQNTDWGHVANWYDSLIGEKGGYFHTHVIFPKTIKLLALKPGMSVLDLACGQGAFSRVLASKDCKVVGVDMGEALIAQARKYRTHENEIDYLVDDARSLNSMGSRKFDRISCILAIQNIDPIDNLFRKVHELLTDGGRAVFVMMHPVIRPPRISGWGVDEAKKLMYRRIDRYLTSMKIPIEMHPGVQNSEVTWAFHRPIEEYIRLARQAHLYVDAMEEWVSDKQSQGKFKDMEDRAREEFPLFLAIRLRRLDHA